MWRRQTWDILQIQTYITIVTLLLQQLFMNIRQNLAGMTYFIVILFNFQFQILTYFFVLHWIKICKKANCIPCAKKLMLKTFFRSNFRQRKRSSQLPFFSSSSLNMQNDDFFALEIVVFIFSFCNSVIRLLVVPNVAESFGFVTEICKRNRVRYNSLDTSGWGIEAIKVTEIT